MEFLKDLLHDRPVNWPDTPEGLEVLCVFIGRQGMGPLLYHSFHASAQWKEWPSFVRGVLEEDFHKAASSRLVLQNELMRVLQHLADVSIFPFLMKGMPLSFSIYPAPNLRPFTDIDLFIEKKDIQAVKEAMISLGYEIPNAVSGELISHEFVCEKKDAYGISHAYDFHWKVLNPLVFSEALSYDEIKKEALPVPMLGPHAKMLSIAQALLLACMHRVAHHPNEDRMIWLYDIYLLLARLNGNGIIDFTELARQKKMISVCQKGLLDMQSLFGLHESGKWQAFLNEKASGEDSVVYLKTRNIVRQNFSSNWSVLRSPADRLKLLVEYAFPSRTYMFQKYATHSHWKLPFLYIRRGLLGLVKLFFSVKEKKLS